MDDNQGRNIWDLLGGVKTEGQDDVVAKSPPKTNTQVSIAQSEDATINDSPKPLNTPPTPTRKSQRIRKLSSQIRRGRQKQLTPKKNTRSATIIPNLALLRRKLSLPTQSAVKLERGHTLPTSPRKNTQAIRHDRGNGNELKNNGDKASVDQKSAPFGPDLLRKARGLLKNIAPPHNIKPTDVLSKDNRECEIVSVTSGARLNEGTSSSDFISTRGCAALQGAGDAASESDIKRNQTTRRLNSSRNDATKSSPNITGEVLVLRETKNSRRRSRRVSREPGVLQSVGVGKTKCPPNQPDLNVRTRSPTKTGVAVGTLEVEESSFSDQKNNVTSSPSASLPDKNSVPNSSPAVKKSTVQPRTLVKTDDRQGRLFSHHKSSTNLAKNSTIPISPQAVKSLNDNTGVIKTELVCYNKGSIPTVKKKRRAIVKKVTYGTSDQPILIRDNESTTSVDHALDKNASSDSQTGEIVLSYDKIDQCSSSSDVPQDVRVSKITVKMPSSYQHNPLDLTKHRKVLPISKPVTPHVTHSTPTPLSPSEIPLDLSMKRDSHTGNSNQKQHSPPGCIAGIINIPSKQLVHETAGIDVDIGSRRVIFDKQDISSRKVSPVRPHIRGRPVPKQGLAATLLPKPQVTVRGVSVVPPPVSSSDGKSSSRLISILNSDSTARNTPTGTTHVIEPVKSQDKKRSHSRVFIPNESSQKLKEPLTAHVKPLSVDNCANEKQIKSDHNHPATHALSKVKTVHKKTQNCLITPVDKRTTHVTSESVSPPELTVISPSSPLKTPEDPIISPTMPVLSPFPQSLCIASRKDMQAMSASPVLAPFASSGKNKVVIIRRQSTGSEFLTSVVEQKSECVASVVEHKNIGKKIVHPPTICRGLPEQELQKLKQMGISYHGPTVCKNPTIIYPSISTTSNGGHSTTTTTTTAISDTVLCSTSLAADKNSSNTLQKKSVSAAPSELLSAKPCGEEYNDNSNDPIKSQSTTSPSTSVAKSTSNCRCSPRLKTLSTQATALLKSNEPKPVKTRYRAPKSTSPRKSKQASSESTVPRKIVPGAMSSETTTNNSTSLTNQHSRLSSVSPSKTHDSTPIKTTPSPSSISAFVPSSASCNSMLTQPSDTFFTNVAFNFTPEPRKFGRITDTKYYVSHTTGKSLNAHPPKHQSKVTPEIQRHKSCVELAKKPIPALAILSAVNEQSFTNWKEEHRFFKSKCCKIPKKLISSPKPKKTIDLVNWQKILIEEASKFDEGNRAVFSDVKTPISKDKNHWFVKKTKRRSHEVPEVNQEILGSTSNEKEKNTETRKRRGIPLWGIRKSTETNGMTIHFSKVKDELPNEGAPGVSETPKKDLVTVSTISREDMSVSPNEKKRRKRHQNKCTETSESVTNPMDIIIKQEIISGDESCPKTDLQYVSGNTIPIYGCLIPRTKPEEVQPLVHDTPVSRKRTRRDGTKKPHKPQRPSTVTGRILTDKEPCCIMHDVELDECEMPSVLAGPVLHPEHTIDDINRLLKQHHVPYISPEKTPPAPRIESPPHADLACKSDITNKESLRTNDNMHRDILHSSDRTQRNILCTNNKNRHENVMRTIKKSQEQTSHVSAAPGPSRFAGVRETSSKRARRRKKRSLLDELTNTDGYIAEKSAKISPSTLFTDPSKLSREDRALQRALMQFSEMETTPVGRTERQAQPQSKVISQASRKAKQLMKKAVAASRKTVENKQARSAASHPEILSDKEVDKKGKRRKRRFASPEEAPPPHGEMMCSTPKATVYPEPSGSATTSYKKKHFFRGHWNRRRRKAMAANRRRRQLECSGDQSVLSLPKPIVEWTTFGESSDFSYQDDEFDETGSIMSSSTCFNGPDGVVQIPHMVKRISVNRDTGETVLHKAARLGYTDVCLWCCQSKYADVNGRDYAGFTAMHECCATGHIAIAKIFLAFGGDPNPASNVDGVRPLHDAVQNDHIEMVRLLLAYGSHPDISTYSGKTLQMMTQSTEMREFLSAYFVDLHGSSYHQDYTSWDFHVDEEDTDETGCDILANLPRDDVTPDEPTFEFSDTSMPPTFSLTLHGSESRRNFVLLQDIAVQLGMRKTDLLKTFRDLIVRRFLVGEFLSQVYNSQLMSSGFDSSRLDVVDGVIELLEYNGSVCRILNIEMEDTANYPVPDNLDDTIEYDDGYDECMDIYSDTESANSPQKNEDTPVITKTSSFSLSSSNNTPAAQQLPLPAQSRYVSQIAGTQAIHKLPPGYQAQSSLVFQPAYMDMKPLTGVTKQSLVQIAYVEIPGQTNSTPLMISPTNYSSVDHAGLPQATTAIPPYVCNSQLNQNIQAPSGVHSHPMLGNPANRNTAENALPVPVQLPTLPTETRMPPANYHYSSSPKLPQSASEESTEECGLKIAAVCSLTRETSEKLFGPE